MAEQKDQSQEPTEEPTARRLEKAREEGQAPRSRELTTSVLLTLGVGSLILTGNLIASGFEELVRYNFQLDREAMFDTKAMAVHLLVGLESILLAVFPVFFILTLAAIIGPIALGGWLFSSKAMAPKLNRMDPIAGFKRMFSAKALMELLKAVAKVMVVAMTGLLLLFIFAGELYEMIREPERAAMVQGVNTLLLIALGMAVSTTLIAAIDIPFQLWQHTKKLRMTHQQVKDELKDTEGKPEVKSRLRQMQRDIANNRMMEKVPDADVVITNPTHYSVALSYDPETMDTPILLAKGGDLIALKIREIAKQHKVEIVESPVLARAVYHTTELDSPIPAGLYLAVAQVLAYVFQLRTFRRGQGPKPARPTRIQVPPDYRFD